MVSIKEDNKRFVVIIDKLMLAQFKQLVAKDKRSTSNLAVKIISDDIEQKKFVGLVFDRLKLILQFFKAVNSMVRSNTLN